MKKHCGQALSWEMTEGVVELALHREPLNEIGSLMLRELEEFIAELEIATSHASALIIYSALPQGFSAGADLRELHTRGRDLPMDERVAGVRQFLERIHRVLNIIDASPLTTIAAVHGVCFGGGFELALACDLIIADKMARFCFPELRLGLIPGFGGIPRLKRDLGNAVVRDLLLTGRSFNVQKAQAIGLVSQVAAEGEACAWRAPPPRRSGSSTGTPALPPSSSSSRSRITNCAARSRSSAPCSPGPPSRRPCGGSSRARTGSRICRECVC